MAKRLLFTFVVLGCAVCLAPEALAAKGIIKTPIGGGGSGSIVVVSETTAFDRTQPGDEISFTETTSPDIKEGSVVTFDIVPGPFPPSGELATDIRFLGTGTVITTNQDKNLDVGANEGFIIKGAIRVDGNIDVVGGNLYVYGGASINGNIKGKNGSNIIIATGTTLDGNVKNGDGTTDNLLRIDGSRIVQGIIKTKNSTTVVLSGNTITGNIHLEKDKDVTVTNSPLIDGNLKVEGVTGTCNVSGNTVTGNTKLDPKCQ